MNEIRAKKSLGQNFLKSKAALREIIEAAALNPEDIILEVGPGKGILTEALIERVKKVIAVEKDDRMIAHLSQTFAGQIASGKLELIHGDILEIKPETVGLRNGGYKIVANIPYYITGQFLRTFLAGTVQPSLMVLMLQKEVAKRIVARDEKESILSISVKVYGMPKYVSTVQAKYFSPEPKVDSAILLISDISKKFFADLPGATAEQKEEQFFALIKKGFAHKRKVLAQNLEIATEKRTKLFLQITANEKARAEDLSLDQWKKLHQLLSTR
jgi:16S rRNA (adenine1518-N6/adenine1519-N6)-dimethyltransferase